MTTIQQTILSSDWNDILKTEFTSDYFIQLTEKLESEFKTDTIFPSKTEILNAFKLCSFKKTKVIIIGQDPYHGINQANGLAFSVSNGVKVPPSLKNIYKELNQSVNFSIPNQGDLSHWANQGVLLLNSCLTVRESEPGSHKNIGWQNFTDNIIKYISNEKTNCVFMLWGKFAQSKTEMIDASKHYILQTTHPSPFSAYKGFFGSEHFKKTNIYLMTNNSNPIDWQL